jgi:hypothetical protein
MDAKPNPDRDNDALVNVSYHAVTRYLQRIVGVAVDGHFSASREEAAAHCDAAGLTLEQVRSLIWTPDVAAGARAGFQSLRTPEFHAQLSVTGVVMTITELKPRPVLGKIKILSDPERKRHDARLHRRGKGKPFKTGDRP